MIDSSKKQGIALDIGGTNVKNAIVAADGKLVGQPIVTPIDSTAGAEMILSTFTAIIQRHLADIEAATLAGVALGFPGPFDYEMGVSYIHGVAKYEAIYGLNVREALQTRLAWPDLPIVFRNDAEAAITAEARYGAGRPYRRLIGLTLGTGCGSAFVEAGLPVTSGQGVAPNGWLYPVLFRGTRADDIFSRRGLEARLRAMGATTFEIKQAAIAACQGHMASRQAFEMFGADLGLFLKPFARNFQAEAILVLGGIAGAFDLFGPTLRQALSIPVMPGELGPDAALLGVADLLFDKRVVE